MKKAVLVGAILFLSAFVLFAQSGPVIAVVNNTGQPIFYVYISLSVSDDWEEDVLGDDVLMPGETLNIRLPRSGTWDFMAVGRDGTEYTLFEIRIPGTDRISIE